MQKILILQICLAIFCFQGVYCRLSRGNIFPPSNFFRQTDEDECINEQIDEHFDNDFDEFEDCVNMIPDFEIDFDDSDEQTDQFIVSNFFRVLCATECGDFYFDVLKECGLENSSTVDALQSLCESNSNGDTCYELLATYLNYGEIERNCTTEYLFNSGTCTCESELEDAVEDLGCCIDAYHQLVEDTVGESVNPQDIYDDCGVDFPAPCSTVSHHVYISMILFAMVVTAVMMA